MAGRVSRLQLDVVCHGSACWRHAYRCVPSDFGPACEGCGHRRAGGTFGGESKSLHQASRPRPHLDPDLVDYRVAFTAGCLCGGEESSEASMNPISVSAPAVSPSLNPEFKSAVRQQTSFLAPLERVCLNWLARNLPSWVKPDHLTLLGFAAMFVAGVCYALAKWWAPALLIVNLCLAVNWFGDSLDGTLARARNKQRPRYGFYVDHIIDAFGILFI